MRKLLNYIRDVFIGPEGQYWNEPRIKPMPRCHCGKKSDRMWMGQGFCGDAHHEQARQEYYATQPTGRKD